MDKMFSQLKSKLLKNGEVVFKIKVKPGAGKDGILDIMSDGIIKIGVAAAPERGKANSRLATWLAEEFGVKKDGVLIMTGQNSKFKLIKIKLCA